MLFGHRRVTHAKCADHDKLSESGVMRRLASILCIATLSVLGCAGNGASSDQDSQVSVFAASSLTDVLNDLVLIFEAKGNDVVLNFAGSSALREQIFDGADPDVFISANEVVMGEVIDAGEHFDDPVVIAENTMTIAVPVGNPAAIRGLPDFAEPSHTLGLCARGVPCGDLAAEVLAANDVVAQPDTLEPNVRSLLSKVEIDELDAALVYRTDIRASGDVEEILLEPGVGGRARYLAASASANDAASAFVEFLTSQEARVVLDEAGFVSP